MLERIKTRLAQFWQGILTLSGDNAYRHYLEHWRREHAGNGARPMSRREFYLSEQQRKWNRPSRCC